MKLDVSYYDVKTPTAEFIQEYARPFLTNEIWKNYKIIVLKDTMDIIEHRDVVSDMFTLKETIIFVDTETFKYKPGELDDDFNGYDNKGKAIPLVKCRLISVYAPAYKDDTVYVFDIADLDIKSQVIDMLDNNIVVYHNAAYDLKIIRPNKLPYFIEDTLYLSRLAFPYMEDKGLDSMVKAFGVYDDIYGTIDKKGTQKSNFGADELTDTQYNYAAADAIATACVFYQSRIQNARNKPVYKLDVINQKYASFYQQHKMYTNTVLIQKGMEEDDETIREYKQKLDDLGYGDLNVRSSVQCKAALSGLAPNIHSSDKQTLVELANDGPNETVRQLADIIFKLRRALKSYGMLSKYQHGWVVSNYNVGGAATGRFTSSGEGTFRGVNTQQIPRARRNMFIPRTGNVIVGADYPTIELRAIAGIYPNLRKNLSKYNSLLVNNVKLDKYWWEAEDVMYGKLKAKIDLHMATAASLSGLDVSEIDSEERFKAKAVNFGLAFGMQARTFQDYAYVNYGLKYTLNESKRIHSTYLDTYPEVDRALEYFIKAHYHLKRRAPLLVSTVYGRITKPRYVTDGINNMIQGSAADIYKLAIHKLVMQSKGEFLKYFIFPLHDAVYLDVPEDKAEYYKTLVKSCMEEAWFETIKSDYFKYDDIPLEVECNVYECLPA